MALYSTLVSSQLWKAMLFFHDGNHLAASPMSRQWGDLAKYGVSVVEGVPPLLEQFE